MQIVDIFLPSEVSQSPTFYAIKLYTPTLILLPVFNSKDGLTFDLVGDVNRHIVMRFSNISLKLSLIDLRVPPCWGNNGEENVSPDPRNAAEIKKSLESFRHIIRLALVPVDTRRPNG